jgi:hypothetical protein
LSSHSPLSPSRSVESGLDKTPLRRKQDDWVFATPEKPFNKNAASNRKVLGSIERGLDKMKTMLTPRKHRLSSASEGPAVVTGKSLCNVSTTSHHNPDYVLNELARALGPILQNSISAENLSDISIQNNIKIYLNIVDNYFILRNFKDIFGHSTFVEHQRELNKAAFQKTSKNL